MLPKPNRLTKKKDFERVIKQGKGVGGVFLILKFVKQGLSENRVGFVVSKKISNKAVVRNKVKRRLREAVRMSLSNLKPGYDLVFFTKKGIEEKEFVEIEKVIKQLLTRAGLLSVSVNVK